MTIEFTDAAASYFGMDPAAVADAHLTTNAEGLTVHFKMRLSDDDMIGIGKRMEERRKKPDPFLNGRSTAEDASHMHYKGDTGTWHPGQSPLAAHYHGPDTRMYRNDGTAIPPAPTKGHL